MARLINLQIIEAKNVICVWKEERDSECDIGFMVPRYIAIGVFADGSMKAGGLIDLNMINTCDNELSYDGDYLFLYDNFLHDIDVNFAKSFVRHAGYDGYDEASAKKEIYKELLQAGVKISDEAKAYLLLRQ